jgi:hypothetical protein
MSEPETPECAGRLRRAVASAEPLLRALPDADSAKRPAPGKWSPREVIGHLVDSASNNHGRFVRAAWADDLVFTGYAQDGWVELQRYAQADWLDLVTLWATFNRHLANVMESIPGSARDRVHVKHNLRDVAFGKLPSSRQATLAWFMDDYVDHLEHHLRQVLGADWEPEETPDPMRVTYTMWDRAM